MYKLLKGMRDSVCGVSTQIGNVLYSIPFDPANTDYARFKKEILAETAELQDADGNTMTAAEAKSYIATLP
jgi:hypothetical protein